MSSNLFCALVSDSLFGAAALVSLGVAACLFSNVFREYVRHRRAERVRREQREQHWGYE